MTYQRFEDLPVWKAAMEFAVMVFALAEDRAFNGCGDARDQLQRAAHQTMKTVVPTSTCSKSHSASGMCIRMQPWEAL